MKVIYKAPGCAPEPRDIPNTLEELQAAVGGYIETVTHWMPLPEPPEEETK